MSDAPNLPAAADPRLSPEDRARRVTDFIAGMTDRYATMKFKQHFFPAAWNAAE